MQKRAHPRKAVVEEDGSACGCAPVSPGGQVAGQRARIRPAGRAEALFHADMQPDGTAAEPTATANREHRRLGQFLPT